MTSEGCVRKSTLKYTQRRHCCGWFSRRPSTVTCPFMSKLLGTITVSQLRVSMAVKRQRISTMRPPTSPTFTQSPTRSDESACSAMPPMMLPSVSWNAKPSTAVSTADVAINDDKLKPRRLATNRIAMIDEPATIRSCMMRGTGTCRRGNNISNNRLPLMAT